MVRLLLTSKVYSFSDFQKRYLDFLARKEISPDPFQESVVQRLEQKLLSYEKHQKVWSDLRPQVKYVLDSAQPSKRSSEDEEFYAPKRASSAASTYRLVSSPFRAVSTQGFYMWGKSGCGKTFISELFFESLAVPQPSKRKLHYNEFMLSVHQRVFALQQRRLPDPLYQFASEFSLETCALYLDEFQVTDIADALILRRLFDLLWSFGVLLLTTSNRAPETLYHNGVQRERFLPFVGALRENCDVVKMEFRKDYREALVLAELGAHAAAEEHAAFYRLKSKEAEQQMFALFLRYSGGSEPRGLEVAAGSGRRVTFYGHKDVLWTHFSELILREMGPDDYIATAKAFRVVFLLNVPQVRSADDNVCRRVIWFVDQAYLYKTKLFVSAERALEELFVYNPAGLTDADLEVGRCLSRLREMQTLKYFSAAHRDA